MATVRYTLRCACGRTRQGRRPARVTLAPCPACGEVQAVYPASPLLKLARPPRPSGAAPRWPWWRPIIAGGLTLALVATLLVVWLARPFGDSAGGVSLESARAQLVEGNLGRAIAQLEQILPTLSGAALGDARQLLAQATLLRDRVPVSVGEMLSRAPQMEPAEWDALFRRDFRGKAVLFDLELRRDARGVLQHGGLPAHPADAGRSYELALEEVPLVRRLATEEGSRYLLAMRLQGYERTQDGGYRLRFDPASAILWTEPGLARQLDAAQAASLAERIGQQAILWRSLPAAE